MHDNGVSLFGLENLRRNDGINNLGHVFHFISFIFNSIDPEGLKKALGYRTSLYIK
jgi:hypothetical protein